MMKDIDVHLDLLVRPPGSVRQFKGDLPIQRAQIFHFIIERKISGVSVEAGAGDSTANRRGRIAEQERDWQQRR